MERRLFVKKLLHRSLWIALALVTLFGVLSVSAFALNPYLPLEHYVPDGEPRVFTYNGETRVYVYGSYDDLSNNYCSDFYRVFSAPVDDLNNWTDHGISFTSTGNHTSEGVADGVSWTNGLLYAPDCIQGADGKFYLYFCCSDSSEGVAVSDTPYGPFTNAKRITFDGSAPSVMAAGTNASMIDPAIFIDDDGKIYYYWGQFDLQAAELNEDMCTIKTSTYNPSVISGPSKSPYTPIPGSFNFHEGSSMRKIGDTYYLVYCSVSSGGANTLEYATGDSPLGPFTYGGVLVNNRVLDPSSWNIHGSLECINGEYYIFCHASTENQNWNRRSRVEKLTLNPDGSFEQAELTSLGFQEYLDPYTQMLAPYACDRGGSCYFGDTTVSGERIFPLVNVTDGSFVGYKYYEFGEAPVTTLFEATVCARNGGTLEVRTGSADGELLGTVAIAAGNGSDWQTVNTVLAPVSGRQAIYLVFRGENGQIADLKSFSFVDMAGKNVVSVSDSVAAQTGAGIYEAGATVTVDAGRRIGYRFTGWTVEGEAQLADPTAAKTTFTMPEGVVNLTANWETWHVDMIYLNGQPLPGFDPETTDYLVDSFDVLPEVTADYAGGEGLPVLTIEQATDENGKQAWIRLVDTADAGTETVKLEAEAATHKAGETYKSSVVSDAKASGGARVDGLNGVGAYVQFQIEVPANVEAQLVFRYAAEPGGVPKFTLAVNGSDVEKLTFAKSGGWDLSKPAELTTTVSLKAGTNTIKLHKADSNDTPLDGINLDYLQVSYENPGTQERAYCVSFVKLPASMDFTKTSREDFLKDWTVVNENAANWTIGENGLTVTTEYGDMWQGDRNHHNLFLQDTAGDWILETKVDFAEKPSMAYQQAAIMAYQDENNYLKVGMQSDGSAISVHLNREMNAKGAELAKQGVDTATIYYRLVKTGDTYEGYYSLDGQQWTYLTTATMAMDNIKIGLMAINGNQKSAEPIPVTFSYVNITPTYTVSFSEAAEAQQVAKNDVVTEPAEPTREGYDFTGWYTDAACTKRYDFATPVTYGMTLYAGWAEESKAVALTLTGAESGSIYDEALTFTLRAENMNRLATIMMDIAIPANLTAPVAEGIGDWFVIGQVYHDGVLTVMLGNNAGDTGDADLMTISAEPTGETGEVEVAITKATLSAHVGEAEDYVAVDLTNASAVIDIRGSIYDVNRDGIVDQLDMTRAQRYFGSYHADADVNTDGEVDLTDLILILNNYHELFE